LGDQEEVQSLQVLLEEGEEGGEVVLVAVGMPEAVPLSRVDLQLVRLSVLYQQVDQLGCVLHEVHVLVHRAVHNHQPALLVRQLAHEVQDGAQLVTVRFTARSVQVPVQQDVDVICGCLCGWFIGWFVGTEGIFTNTALSSHYSPKPQSIMPILSPVTVVNLSHVIGHFNELPTQVLVRASRRNKKRCSISLD